MVAESARIKWRLPLGAGDQAVEPFSPTRSE
jgi:hypothetical protein